MIDFIIATSVLMNPILTLVLSLNVCLFIIKISKNDYKKIKTNIVWICISSMYLIFTLTMLFGNIGNIS